MNVNEPEYQRMRECEDRHWWYVVLHELILRFIAEEYRVRGSLRMFDAGCGTGGLLERLAPFGEACGCDLSSHALRHCRDRGLNHVMQADLNAFALPPSTFDVVTCVDVLEHHWVKSDAAVLAALHAGLKPGGLLLLNCTAFELLRSAHDEAVHTSRRYAPASLRRLVVEAGFRIERSTCRMFLLFVPLAVHRLARRVLRYKASNPPTSDVWLPPPILNASLLLVGRLENLLQGLMALPVGTSIFVVARKPVAARAPFE